MPTVPRTAMNPKIADLLGIEHIGCRPRACKCACDEMEKNDAVLTKTLVTNAKIQWGFWGQMGK